MVWSENKNKCDIFLTFWLEYDNDKLSWKQAEPVKPKEINTENSRVICNQDTIIIKVKKC